MFRILLILSFCNIIASSGEHNKYIDLLPEKEKREFLERIARRIFEEIKTKDVLKHSQAEIPDEQLEVHNAYVQGIMEEEVKNLRNKEPEDLIIDGISPNTQSVKEINKDHNVHDVRTRQKRMDINVQLLDKTKHQESTYPTITVNSVKIEDTVDDENTTLKKSNNIVSTTTEKTETNNGTKNYDQAPDSPTIFVKSLENNTGISHTLSRKLKNVTNLVNDIKKMNESYTPITLDANPGVTSSYLDIYVGGSNKIFTSSTIKPHKVKETSKSLAQEEYTGITSEGVSIVSATTTKDVELEKSNENITDIDNAAAKISNVVTLNKTFGTAAETKTLEHLNTSKSNNQINVGNISLLAQGTKNVLRMSQNMPVFYKSSKYYEVYEIGPGKSPFEKRKAWKSQKQPYDAPVYNFDPENAYYNPYNRFGPYSGDTKNQYEVLRNEIKSQKDANHNGIYFEKPVADALSYFAKILRPPKRYEHHPATYVNPDDYFDVQYSTGRIDEDDDDDDENDTRKHYPNSYEIDHPYKSIDKYQPLKDHLSDIRNFLYLYKRFGYIPPVKSKNEKSCTNIDKSKHANCSKRNLKPNESNKKRGEDKKPPISMDYYFDRTELMTESEEYDSLELEVPFTAKLNTNMTYVADEYDDIEYRALLKVLRDMVRMENEELVEYPWLKTTVDIQTAVFKLTDLIYRFNFNKAIHPRDLELLKYVFYLYKSSMSNLQYENNGVFDRYNSEYDITQTRQLPRPRFNCTRHKCKGHRCRTYRCKKPRWIMMKKLRDEDVYNQQLTVLHELEDFLNEIQFHLTYFHEVIKEIATFRTYNTQQWFSDIKDMYLEDASDRQLGGVLLHLTLAKLIHLVDAAQEAQDGFQEYVQNYPKVVQETKNEFTFALRILQHLRSI